MKYTTIKNTDKLQKKEKGFSFLILREWVLKTQALTCSWLADIDWEAESDEFKCKMLPVETFSPEFQKKSWKEDV